MIDLADYDDFKLHVDEAQHHMDLAWIAIEKYLDEFLQNCRDERTETRCDLRAESKARGRGAKIKTSPFVLIGGMERGALELNWTRIWYSPQTGDAPQYDRVPTNDAGRTHLTKITRRSPHWEVEVIRNHEIRVRKFRKIWSRYIAARHAVRTLRNALSERRVSAKASEDSVETYTDFRVLLPARLPER